MRLNRNFVAAFHGSAVHDSQFQVVLWRVCVCRCALLHLRFSLGDQWLHFDLRLLKLQESTGKPSSPFRTARRRSFFGKSRRMSRPLAFRPPFSRLVHWESATLMHYGPLDRRPSFSIQRLIQKISNGWSVLLESRWIALRESLRLCNGFSPCSTDWTIWRKRVNLRLSINCTHVSDRS